MKTIELTLYTLAELKAQHPAGYKRALKNWESRDIDNPWLDETFDSLKAVFDKAGVKLKDYSISAYSYSYIKPEFPGYHGDAIGDLQGKRAMAWLENHLFSYLRTPWRGPKRWSVTKYGREYRAGYVKPCPFTGYCMDDILLESLRDSVRKGHTLKDAFRGLADVVQESLRSEDEYQRSEEAFLESYSGYGGYTEEGEEYP